MNCFSIFRIAAALAIFSLCAVPGSIARAQSPAQASDAAASAAPAKQQPDTVITPEQARDLFASVDQILQFDSHDSGLPIKHQVKRQLTSRAAVEKYLESQMKNGKDARRMLRSAIVMKKFGLLPRNFDLGPFMVKLLREQIAGYYNSKTKTVYLLNWIAPDIQKPVMAHELMHALQDQYVGLSKWSNPSLEGISHNMAQDNRHIRLDEDDTARQAVLEGQAMVTYVDYALRPHHVTIADNPNFMLSHLNDLMNSSSDSPVMASAPRVLRESLIFPYKEGLRFEIEVLRDEGKQAAFAGVLDNPPSSSYQILTPSAYEHHLPVPVLTMPNIHPLIDHEYKPYDIGVMGELDARMLLQLTTSDNAASRIAAQWDGGIYYVAQKKDAADAKSTASVALFYLSHWKTPAAAHLFAENYETEVNKKYAHAKLQPASTAMDRIYSTGEGPVLISISGRYVFVSESFPLKMARKLDFMLLGAQHSSANQETAAYRNAYPDLTGGLRNVMEQAGILRVELPSTSHILHVEDQHESAIYTGISVKSHLWGKECNRRQ